MAGSMLAPILHVVAAVCGCTLLSYHVQTMEFTNDKPELRGNSVLYKEVDVRGDLDQYMNENRRAPQNVMQTNPASLVSDNTLVYSAWILNKATEVLLQSIASDIQEKTCIKVKYVTIDYARKHPKEKVCILHDMDSRSDASHIMDYSFKVLLKCLGKLYEHVRLDRDKYIKIMWENIGEEDYKWFKIHGDSTSQGMPYDFQSCMQFTYDEYSRNGEPSYLPLNESIPSDALGTQQWPSDQDYLDIKLSYCGTETAIKFLRAFESGVDFITLTWCAPKFRPQVMEFKYECSLEGEPTPYVTSVMDFPIKVNSLNLTGLRPGSLCKVHVAAVYNPARVDPGIKGQFRTRWLPPIMPPLNVKKLSVGGARAKFSWKPIPSHARNGEITNYLVSYTRSKGGTSKREGASLSPVEEEEETTIMHKDSLGITLDHLRRNTRYAFQVAGINAAGRGPFSSPLPFITLGDTPGKVRVTGTKVFTNSITIEWIPPLDENKLPHDVILKYTCSRKRYKKEYVPVRLSGQNSWKVDGLHTGSAVSFSFTAINLRGEKGPTTSTVLQTI